jgi:hypothetical protein
LVHYGSWQIGIPAHFSGTLAIEVGVGYDGRWYSKEAAIWTSTNSPTGIALGNVAFVYTFLSGTIGTVTINGNTPDYVSVYARIAGSPLSLPVDSVPVNGPTWTLAIPSGFTGTLAIGVLASYQGTGQNKDVTTWASGSPNTTNIALGNVTIGSSSSIPIAGTVTINGTTPLPGGLLAVYGELGSTPQDFFAQTPLATAMITNGSFSDTASAASGYVVVAVPNGVNYTGYITVGQSGPAKVDLDSSMSLNLSEMLSLGDFDLDM